MYDQDAAKGSDVWGKLYFHSTPFSDDGPYYAGLVTPVIHYCMGGITVSTNCRLSLVVSLASALPLLSRRPPDPLPPLPRRSGGGGLGAFRLGMRQAC